MNELILAILLSTQPSAKDKCLARAIYHEARGSTFKAKVAVRDTVLNRARSSGESVCKVLYKKNQFSWTAKKHKKQVNKKYTRVIRAKPVLDKRYLWFFRNDIVRPVWSKNLVCNKIVDKHVHCRA